MFLLRGFQSRRFVFGSMFGLHSVFLYTSFGTMLSYLAACLGQVPSFTAKKPVELIGAGGVNTSN